MWYGHLQLGLQLINVITMMYPHGNNPFDNLGLG